MSARAVTVRRRGYSCDRTDAFAHNVVCVEGSHRSTCTIWCVKCIPFVCDPHIMLFEYETKTIQDVHGREALSVRWCLCMFEKFRSGDYSLVDHARFGCPVAFDSDILNAIPSLTAIELSCQVNATLSTITNSGACTVPSDSSTANRYLYFTLFSASSGAVFNQNCYQGQKWCCIVALNFCDSG